MSTTAPSTETRNVETETFGLLAEFESAESLVEATRAAHEDGYRKMNAYAPFPIPELPDALGFEKTWVPQVVLVGGIVGALVGFGLQYWVSVEAYPLNIGGRPPNSWPSFIPVTFEFTILFAALAAVLGMLALNMLPQPWHPLFEVPAFSRATQDRFFLSIRAIDPAFDTERTREFLQRFQTVEVYDVPAAPQRD